MSNYSISELFIKEAIKTESVNFTEIAARLSDKRTIRLLHAAMGLSTEANEFLDAMKKYIFYGKELDLVNIAEELGDGNWYEAIALDELGKSFDEILIAVIQKLRKRYNNMNFSEEAAINRNLKEERTELEKVIDLATGFDMGAKKLTEEIKTNLIKDNVERGMIKSIVNKVKMEIIDDPITHWLADVDKLTVLCTNEKPKEGEKYTLERKLVTCHDCLGEIAEISEE